MARSALCFLLAGGCFLAPPRPNENDPRMDGGGSGTVDMLVVGNDGNIDAPASTCTHAFSDTFSNATTQMSELCGMWGTVDTGSATLERTGGVLHVMLNGGFGGCAWDNQVQTNGVSVVVDIAAMATGDTIELRLTGPMDMPQATTLRLSAGASARTLLLTGPNNTIVNVSYLGGAITRLRLVPTGTKVAASYWGGTSWIDVGSTNGTWDARGLGSGYFRAGSQGNSVFTFDDFNIHTCPAP